MEQFLELFGQFKVLGLTVYKWFLIAGAAIFLVKGLQKGWTILMDLYGDYKKRQQKLQEALSQVAKYPTWHQQSLDIQKQFATAIEGLQNGQRENNERLEKMEKENQRRERNKLRDRILQSYRYYNSSEKNPMLAWSEMEADAFWKIFKDYEDLDGDGYVHSEVQPAMNSLDVIPMHETEKISELMRSRK